MSQENVEIVRRGWDIFRAGLEAGNLGVLWDEELFAPDATVIASQEAFGGKTYVGREGFVEWMTTWTEDFLDYRIVPEEIIDAGEDRVLTIARQSATGKGSGAAVEDRVGVIHTVAGGQVVEQRNFLDLAEAYTAVGLPAPR